ncbi:SapC family protein [Paraferrimonas sp. SM1919]|uniref:SapC family protein n=1 Tax=Paraferrimonas sp. SM1919 TaxID=2662263 RepID=UPI0013D8310E|nr:SapC family protein [Paraferrimonas sp. SM1919]
MTNVQLLNQNDHQNVKINTARSVELGDNLWTSITFLEEFRNVQQCYPIFFQKDQQSGRFLPHAMFGFQHNENLFLTEQGWDASYIPVSVKRLPFLIGMQKQVIDGKERSNRVIHIDMDSPRVSESQGEPLFNLDGSPTDYLKDAGNMLELMHHGLESTQKFIDAICELELLESFTLDITLNDGSENQMIGFYTINEDLLNDLTAEQLAGLHKQGYLQAIYMIIASQSHVRELVRRKNATVMQAQTA